MKFQKKSRSNPKTMKFKTNQTKSLKFQSKNSETKASDSKPKKGQKKLKDFKSDFETIKNIDPDVYKFLKQNDKQLIDCGAFDSGSEDDDSSQVNGDPKSVFNNGEDNSEPNSDEEEQDDENDSDEEDTNSEQNADGVEQVNESNAESDEDNAANFEPNSDEHDADSDEEEGSINTEASSDEEENDDNEKFHKATSGDLQNASDESDYDNDNENEDSKKITLNLLRKWQQQLEKPKVSIDIIRNVIQAFNSALASISGEEMQRSEYQVNGTAVFNGVLQLCVLHLQQAICNFLGLKTKSNMPICKLKKWPKIRSCLRNYLMDLSRLIEHVSSSNILSVLLKHLHQMGRMVAPFNSISKAMLKRLIVIWATSDETVRILAFLCILKITRSQQISMLNHVLKSMYLSYVRNSKFVSPSSLPGINFMRRSLVEMFILDLNATYQHAFLYIRQLAIHLRNAVILKKKDSFQSVYNWQFINSLRLWAELLGATADKTQLQPLIYPLVTIIIGVIKLIPTAQYFPLRFHCIQALVLLTKETNTFIPVLPFILEVLKSNTFNKKHTIVSMKPMQFTCILRLNKTQLNENGFGDEVIDNVCSLMLEYLAHESSSLAYADLVVPAVLALKQYIKECKNSNRSRKIKQLLDKIQENSKFIESERRKINFELKDTAAVRAWETQIRNKETPLSVYYKNWMSTHEKKKRRQASNADNINDYDLPVIQRKQKKFSNENNGEVELFPSDSEDENIKLPQNDEYESSEEKSKLKTQKKKKTKKVIQAAVDEEDEVNDKDYVDIVEDIDDW